MSLNATQLDNIPNCHRRIIFFILNIMMSFFSMVSELFVNEFSLLLFTNETITEKKRLCNLVFHLNT